MLESMGACRKALRARRMSSDLLSWRRRACSLSWASSASGSLSEITAIAFSVLWIDFNTFAAEVLRAGRSGRFGLRKASQRAWVGGASSSQPAVLIQQGDHISDSPGVEGRGVELVPELDKIALSLLLSSESRAFSFSICSISLSICSDSLLTRKDSLLRRSDSLLSCFVRSFEALICFSMSGLRRQLSVCNHKRHRGNDEPHAPLLLELEADACWEGDVVIRAEQGDQGNHEAGMGLDDSLAIKPRAALGRIWTFLQVWRRFGWWSDLRQSPGPSRL